MSMRIIPVAMSTPVGAFMTKCHWLPFLTPSNVLQDHTDLPYPAMSMEDSRYDNAAAENFFGVLKRERATRKVRVT